MLRCCATFAAVFAAAASLPATAPAAQRFHCPVSAARLSAVVGRQLRKDRQEARGAEGTCVFTTAVRRQLSITFLLERETMRDERATWNTYLPHLAGIGVVCPRGLVDRPDLGRHAFQVVCRSGAGMSASLVVPGAWTITLRTSRRSAVGLRTLSRAAAASRSGSAGARGRA